MFPVESLPCSASEIGAALNSSWPPQEHSSTPWPRAVRHGRERFWLPVGYLDSAQSTSAWRI